MDASYPPPSFRKFTPRPKRRSSTTVPHVPPISQSPHYTPTKPVKAEKNEVKNAGSKSINPKNGTISALRNSNKSGTKQLLLSVIIAVGYSYQRDRMKMEMKAKCKDTDSDSNLKSESEPLKGMYSDQISANCSFTSPPPQVAQRSKHQPSSNHPLPIPPPQPPFYSRNNSSHEFNCLLDSKINQTSYFAHLHIVCNMLVIFTYYLNAKCIVCSVVQIYCAKVRLTDTVIVYK